LYYYLDIDECLTGQRCDVNAICTNTEGSFKCACKERFSGDGFTCKPIDVCSNPMYNPCNLQTTNCVFDNESATSRCNCKPGFMKTTESSTSCEDIDECSPIEPRHMCSMISQTCINTVGSYKCQVKAGYKELMNGTVIEIDECIEAHGNAICEAKNAKCVDKLLDFFCVCDVGFRFMDGLCQNIDECVEKLDNCSSNMVCLDTIGSYLCMCQSGFDLVRRNGMSICSKRHLGCVNNKECPEHSSCNEQVGICNAQPGYELVNNPNLGWIAQDIDECTTSNPCAQCPPPVQCINTEGSYRCVCPDGSKPKACVCENLCNKVKCKWMQKCVMMNAVPECQCKCFNYTSLPRDPLCMLFGNFPNTFQNKEHFYQAMCMNKMLCALPAKQPDIESSANFNYHGKCIGDVNKVRCLHGVKPIMHKGFPICRYSKRTFTYAFAECTKRATASKY
uniref:EGF-like domain-containing protein n=1 Tax=Soboliphyme baturini TaxID=241478 RepID=A0A183IXD9_9BILA